VGSEAEPRQKTNLVHSKAVRKPLFSGFEVDVYKIRPRLRVLLAAAWGGASSDTHITPSPSPAAYDPEKTRCCSLSAASVKADDVDSSAVSSENLSSPEREHTALFAINLASFGLVRPGSEIHPTSAPTVPGFSAAPDSSGCTPS